MLAPMERLLFLWDEVDDTCSALRHMLTSAWHELCGGIRRRPRVD